MSLVGGKVYSPIIFLANHSTKEMGCRTGIAVDINMRFLARTTISTVPAAWRNFLFFVWLLFSPWIKSMSKPNSGKQGNQKLDSDNASSSFTEEHNLL